MLTLPLPANYSINANAIHPEFKRGQQPVLRDPGYSGLDF